MTPTISCLQNWAFFFNLRKGSKKIGMRPTDFKNSWTVFKTTYWWAIDYLHNYCLGLEIGASFGGRSVTCICFQCFRRAESCVSCLCFGLFWVRFIGFGSSKLKLEHCSSEKVPWEKIRGHSWSQKAEFLERWVSILRSDRHLAYTLCVHLRPQCVSMTILSAILRVCILDCRNSSWNITRLKEYFRKRSFVYRQKSFEAEEKRKLKWETHTSQSVLAGDAPNLVPGP